MRNITDLTTRAICKHVANLRFPDCTYTEVITDVFVEKGYEYDEIRPFVQNAVSVNSITRHNDN